MNAAWVALGGISLFILAYRIYGRFLERNIFAIHKNFGQPTPAHVQEDGIDFVPTKREILFGHHFSSIAGASPIVGPAIAVIWGWVPALIWIIFGSIFMGAAYDFATLILSMKYRGQTVGCLVKQILGVRARAIFLTVMFFLIWVVIAVFALIIANLFMSYPQAVLPVNFEIIIAVLMGVFIGKKKGSLKLPSLLAQATLFVMIYLGMQYPLSLQPLFGEHEMLAWMVFLMAYGFIASILPVWALLQPRDYINGHQLFVGLFLMIAGLFVTHPTIVAPAFNADPIGAPSWFPFLFITVACGAISGFHGLISSGTTAKQIDKWEDARFISYGGMLIEGLLAMLAVLAVCAGFKDRAAWTAHYSSWDAANGLSAKMDAFVQGAGNFIAGLGIPEDFAQSIMVVLIISFAATSLDTAVRIQRYIISEIGVSVGVPILRNRFVGAFLAVGTAMILMFTTDGGKGGLSLWPLFGTTNQMLTGLALIVIAVYLYQKKRPTLSFILPAIFIIIVTTISLVMNINLYHAQENYLLVSVAVILLFCQFWITVIGLGVFRKIREEQ
ncbi:MAG: carbon starvation CstA family protein [Alphaproteobacteria bacterium]